MMIADQSIKEKHETDKNNQKPEIEIFCRIRIPLNFYEIANVLSIIHNMKSFDEYVSQLVYNDIERLMDGVVIIEYVILNKISGRDMK